MYILFFLLLLGSWVHAENVEEANQAILDDHPSALVAGRVNAITGSFQVHQCDLVVSAPEPLMLTRSYSSGDKSYGGLRQAWHLNHQGSIRKLEHERVWSIPEEEPHGYMDFRFLGPSGERLYFLGKDFLEGDPFRMTFGDCVINPAMFANGLTNVSGGEISARTNLKNTQFKYTPCMEEYLLTTSYGSKMYFNEVDKNSFILKEHKLPSEYKIKYSYSQNFLHRITCLSPKKTEMAQLKMGMNPTLHVPDIYFVTSDGRKVTYQYKKKRGKGLLSKVIRCDGGVESYHYAHTKIPLLQRQEFPEGRYIEVDYYPEDTHFKNRVHHLFAPIGPDGSKQTLYTFHYRDTIKQEGSDWTEVLDAHNNRTDYLFDGCKRLHCVKTYDRNGKVYSQQRMEWSPEGLLLGRTFQDAEGRSQFEKKYFYDKKGNVLKEYSFGVFTGRNPQDRIRKFHTYTDDDLNLLTSSRDHYKKITLEYLPGTSCMCTRYTWQKDAIVQREYFDYNEERQVIREMVDDGNSTDKNNLAGLTQRSIKVIKPRTEAPFGLPQEIQEKYLEIGSHQEKLLHRTLYHYSKEGFLLKQEHFDSQNQYVYALSWEYDAMGRATQETDALGHTLCKKYDLNGNLIFQQGPTQDSYVEYTYDLANRLIKTEEIHLDGTRIAETHTYDLLGQRSTTTDRYGQTQHYHYDEFGRLILTVAPNNVEKRQTYNSLNQIVSTTDSMGNSASFENNTRGQPLHIRYPDGTQEHFIYRLDGKLFKHITPQGLTHEYIRDWQGRVIKHTCGDQVQTYTYNTFHLLAETDAAGVETTYKYNSMGRKISVCKGMERTDYRYDNLGRVAQICSYYSEKEYTVKAYTYDLLNSVIEESIQDAAGNNLLWTAYTYDTLGRKTHVTTKGHAGTSIAETRYNSCGEVIKTIDPLGNKTHFAYIHHYLNDHGQQVLYTTVTDPQGVMTHTQYDVLGRVVKIHKTDTLGSRLAAQEYVYDSLGRCIKTVDIVYPEKKSITSQTTYDQMGRILTLQKAVGTADEQTFIYQYNALGQREKLIKPDEVILSTTYDEMGRPKTLISSDNTITYQYFYDIKGNCIQVENQLTHQSTQLCFDVNNRLIKETLENALSVEYDYDRQGRMTGMTLPQNQKVQYLYNAAFLISVNRPNYNHTYIDYDLTGQPREAKLIKKGGTTTYEYDLKGRYSTIFHPEWEEDGLRYNKVDCLTKRKVREGQNTQSYHYTYDGLQQLESESGVYGNTYQHDSLLNRIKKNKQIYKNNFLNQLLEWGENKCVYDKNGNLIQDKYFLYTYDALNRVVKIMLNVGRGVTSAQYSYDGFNRRMTKQSLVGNEIYLYSGQNELGSLDTKTNLYKELRILGRGLGAEIGAAVAMEIGNKNYVPLHDHSGNVTALLDAKGNMVEYYRYTAFGEEEVFNGAGEKQKGSQVKNPWRYASKRYDEETRTVFFGRRSYDPEKGRWRTPDPLGGTNVYAYVDNNPLTSIDHYGLEREHIPNLYDRMENEREGLEGLGFCKDFEENRGDRNYSNDTLHVSNLLKLPGEAILFIGEHLVPIPFVRDAVAFGGHLLAGKPWNSYEASWKREHSAFYYMDSETGYDDPNKAYFLMNGIMTIKKCMVDRVAMCQDVINGDRVYFVYISTKGLAMDLLDSLLTRLGFWTHASQVSYEGVSYLGERKNQIVVPAHSLGGAKLNQLSGALSKVIRDKIFARTIGSPWAINSQKYKSVQNHRNFKDWITLGSPSSHVQACLGFRQDIIYHKSKVDGFCLFDHDCEGKTYLPVLIDCCEEYNKL